jgi:L-seryl-tRNA(Ser) seleniumtransferase
MEDIPTSVVTIAPRAMSATALEARLRLGEPAIVARIKDGRLILDPRTLSEDEEIEVIAVLECIAQGA